ncbi:MAG: hypothetical protein WCZ19_04510 [Acholeplasma sp.]
MRQLNQMSIYDIVLVAILSAVVFIQEQFLSFLPNVQLTIFLVVLFSRKLGILKTSLIITIHVIIDGLFTSSLGVIYTPFIFVGLITIPVTLNTIFKKVSSTIALSFLGVLYEIIYSWLFLIPFVYILHVDPVTYIIADIPFQLLLASSSFMTILLLYEPSSNLFDLLKIDKTV